MAIIIESYDESEITKSERKIINEIVDQIVKYEFNKGLDAVVLKYVLASLYANKKNMHINDNKKINKFDIMSDAIYEFLYPKYGKHSSIIITKLVMRKYVDTNSLNRFKINIKHHLFEVLILVTSFFVLLSIFFDMKILLFIEFCLVSVFAKWVIGIKPEYEKAILFLVILGFVLITLV